MCEFLLRVTSTPMPGIPTSKRTPGRPSKLRQVVRSRDTRDPQGQRTGARHDVTVFDSIVEDVRAAGYIEPAAKHANVHKASVYEWIKIGAAASMAIHQGHRTRDDLSPHEADCLAFSDAVDDAKAEFILRQNLLLEQLAQGGLPQIETTTVEKIERDADGTETVVSRETRTKTTHTLPDAATLRWRLERTFPDLYGRRVTVEGTGEEGAIPLEVRAAAMLVTARKFIKTTAVEVDAAADVEAGELLPEDEADSPLVEDRAVALAESAARTVDEQR